MNASSSRSQSSGQDELSRAWDKLSSSSRDTVGLMGFFTAVTVYGYPLYVLKHRLPDEPVQSLGQDVRDLIRKEGWGVFYRGSGRVFGHIFAYGAATIWAFECGECLRGKEE